MPEINSESIFQLECYCRRLRLVYNKTTRLYDIALSPMGISSQQFSLLAVLYGKEKMNITEMAEKMELDRTTVSRNIKVLVGRGLLQEDSGGGRKKSIELTEKGRQAFEKAVERWKTAQYEFENILGEDLSRELFEKLDEITAALKVKHR